jgi:hypothetical protein
MAGGNAGEYLDVLSLLGTRVGGLGPGSRVLSAATAAALSVALVPLGVGPGWCTWCRWFPAERFRHNNIHMFVGRSSLCVVDTSN